jgi:hypothetical protein
MTHKEFYIWLDGFMTNRRWTDFKQGDIETIQEKMKEVKEDNRIGIAEPYRVPIPINPFPNDTDPYKPPYEVYCGDKTQLND